MCTYYDKPEDDKDRSKCSEYMEPGDPNINYRSIRRKRKKE